MFIVDGIGPAHDHETITHKQLEAAIFSRKGLRFALKWADDAVGQTDKAVRFKDVDREGRSISFWVPKSACDRVIYVAPDGRCGGAFRFPARFAPNR